MQGIEAVRSQFFAALLEVGVDLVPDLDGVVVVGDIYRLQNGLPKLLDGLALSHSRKNLFGPRFTGDGGYSPLVF